MATSPLLYLPRTELRCSTLEAAKWVALVCMVVDHVNAVFFDRDLGILASAAGRLSMPLFALVIGYNLARPGVDFGRVLNRLLLFGMAALPFHAALFSQIGSWWPLNILATFGVAVACISLYRDGSPVVASVVFLLGGSVVEYWWPGVALVIAAYLRFRPVDPIGSGWLFAALVGLCVVNANAWALLAVPVLHGLNAMDVTLPRLRWVFWFFYPIHLAVLYVLWSVFSPGA